MKMKKAVGAGSLWADYYINMLDSNSIANNGNYMESYIAPDSQLLGYLITTSPSEENRRIRRRPTAFGI